MKGKYAVYDYCETLVSFQTANEFIFQYVKHNLNTLSRVKAYLLVNLEVFKRQRKCLLLQLLKGQRREDIELFSKYYTEQWLQKHLNEKVIADLVEKKKKGYTVVIISAGFSVYIESHNEFINADVIIANDFVYESGIFNGTITRKDCHGEEKLNRLDDIVGLENIDLENSYFFSDCLSDLPLFEVFGNRFIIKKGEIEELELDNNQIQDK